MKRLITDNEELLQVLEDNGIETICNENMEIEISDEDAERIDVIAREYAPAALMDYSIE